MSDHACSKGCFCCSQTGDGAATRYNQHSNSCCKSTLCNSRAWDKQVARWLLAETMWTEKQAANQLPAWLLAEQLWTAQVHTWLEAEASHAAQCESWLRAEQQFRSTLRVRTVKRVRVQAAPSTPQTAKLRAHAR